MTDRDRFTFDKTKRLYQYGLVAEVLSAVNSETEASDTLDAVKEKLLLVRKNGCGTYLTFGAPVEPGEVEELYDGHEEEIIELLADNGFANNAKPIYVQRLDDIREARLWAAWELTCEWLAEHIEEAVPAPRPLSLRARIAARRGELEESRQRRREGELSHGWDPETLTRDDIEWGMMTALEEVLTWLSEYGQ